MRYRPPPPEALPIAPRPLTTLRRDVHEQQRLVLVVREGDRRLGQLDLCTTTTVSPGAENIQAVSGGEVEEDR